MDMINSTQHTIILIGESISLLKILVNVVKKTLLLVEKEDRHYGPFWKSAGGGIACSGAIKHLFMLGDFMYYDSSSTWIGENYQDFISAQ